MTSILLDTKLSKHQRECALLVRDSGNTLLNLIDDICDFRKIESGRLKEEMHVEAFNFLDALSQSIGIVSTHARTKGLELVVDVDNSKECHCVLGDVSLTLQLMLNLLGNAIKFTETGHVSIAVKHLKGPKRTVFLECSISDTGIGIPYGASFSYKIILTNFLTFFDVFPYLFDTLF
jgi:signal transduction histidine kinase